MLKKLILNKKGSSDDMIYYMQFIVRSIFLVAFSVIFIYVVIVFSNNSLDSHKINNLVIEKRIFYSPNSLAYQDSETGRVYPGVIDLKKAEQSSFEKAFILSETDYIAAKIEINSLSGELLKEVYINKDKYERWSPLSRFERYSKEIYQKPVQIREGETSFQGIIKINVINQNE